MAQAIEEVVVGTASLKVKFMRTIKLSSITDDKFKLMKVSASPSFLADPFIPIAISQDYNTISRVLTLYYRDVLDSAVPYTFTVTGLQSPTGDAIPTESVTFTSPTITTSTPDDTDDTGSSGGTTVEYEVEDYSVKDDIPIVPGQIVDNLDFVSASTFRIVDTDPSASDPVVDTDYNDGRITIKFSQMPAATYINSSYFKVQRKPIQREFSRWESVSVHYAVDTVKPWVYLDFPSTDDTPVYHTTGKDYFPLDYKYRVRVLKEVEPSATSSGGSSTGKLNLTIQQGATFSKTLTYLQASGAPRDLTGYSAKTQIKTGVGGALIKELSTSNGGIIITGVAGQVTMFMSPSQTTALTPGTYVYDLELTSSGATPVVTRLVEGTVKVTPEVTT